MQVKRYIPLAVIAAAVIPAGCGSEAGSGSGAFSAYTGPTAPAFYIPFEATALRYR